MARESNHASRKEWDPIRRRGDLLPTYCVTVALSRTFRTLKSVEIGGTLPADHPRSTRKGGQMMKGIKCATLTFKLE